MAFKDCVFCKILSGEIRQDILYEDDKTIAILDIYPASPRGGHTLVMPKKHYELISEMSDDDAKTLILTTKKLSKALLKFGEGMNILQNNNKVAGQYVPHVHFHLIPRFANDNIIISEKWSKNEYKGNEMKEVASRIKSLLKD